jgi:hypothetical protein
LDCLCHYNGWDSKVKQLEANLRAIPTAHKYHNIFARIKQRRGPFQVHAAFSI